MEFKRLKRFFIDQSCYFFQSNKCVLHKKHCEFCRFKTQRIEGITSTTEYLKYVTDKNNMEKNYRISLIALILSTLLTIAKLYDIFIKK